MAKILTLLFCLLFSSCGFYSFTGASISPQIETVSIMYFPNKANIVQSSLSAVFTEKLKDYFTKQTNLNLIDSEGDLLFSGEIISYTINPISIQSNETALQNRITIKVKVKFVNNIDHKMNFHTTFMRYRDFPANEDLSTLEEILMEDICDELVEDIFNKSVVNW